MDYNQYSLCSKELIQIFLWYIFVSGVTGILFYNTLWFMVAGIPLFFMMSGKEKERRKNRRKEQLKREFKEFMLSMAAALQAGYALENTISVIQDDLLRAFPSGPCYLAEECACMKHSLEMKRPVEELLQDLGTRSGVEEMQDFAQVISTAKRSGGNMVQIIRSTAEQMRDAMEVRQEIAVAVAAKSLEQKIMLLMPFGITGYLRLTNPGYLDCLYGNWCGVLVMSGCLGMILVSSVLAKQILTIEVR